MSSVVLALVFPFLLFGGVADTPPEAAVFIIIGHGSRNRDQVSAIHKYDEPGDSNKSYILPTTTTLFEPLWK